MFAAQAISSLADRKSKLLVDHIGELRAAFRYVQQRHPFAFDAIVVLPDHLHAIWTLPDGDADFPVRWRLVKSAFSRALPAGEGVSAQPGNQRGARDLAAAILGTHIARRAGLRTARRLRPFQSGQAWALCRA
jgi:REP element-mobilizing transposase RayT